MLFEYLRWPTNETAPVAVVASNCLYTNLKLLTPSTTSIAIRGNSIAFGKSEQTIQFALRFKRDPRRVDFPAKSVSTVQQMHLLSHILMQERFRHSVAVVGLRAAAARGGRRSSREG